MKAHLFDLEPQTLAVKMECMIAFSNGYNKLLFVLLYLLIYILYTLFFISLFVFVTQDVVIADGTVVELKVTNSKTFSGLPVNLTICLVLNWPDDLPVCVFQSFYLPF